MKDIFENFSWHSSFDIGGNKKVVRKLDASSGNLKKFIRANDKSDFLIHKATKALWKFSEDGTYIEPVFEEDMLVEEDI